jgi:hypothetical protein
VDELMRTARLVGLLCSGIAGLAAGCGTLIYPDALNTNLTETNGIVNDPDLDGAEKRSQLAALGIPETTINALLRDTRTANQFGGTLESAYDKVVGDNFTGMTPDEIQLYGDATDETTFSDEQAQALQDFFGATGINTATALETYLDTPGSEIPAVLDAGEVRAVFVDFNPDDVLDDLP